MYSPRVLTEEQPLGASPLSNSLYHLSCSERSAGRTEFPGFDSLVTLHASMNQTSFISHFHSAQSINYGKEIHPKRSISCATKTTVPIIAAPMTAMF